jgi:hypothetical protein
VEVQIFREREFLYGRRGQPMSWPSMKPMDESPKTVEGDIVVTRVAHHYALGRVTADGRTQTSVGAVNDRSGALHRACILAGDDHRVFLCELAGPGGVWVQIDCDEGFEAQGGERRYKPRPL